MCDQATAAGQADALRRQAEEQARRQAAQTPENLEAPSPQAAGELLRELQVHQIELDLQNEELRRAQEALEAARARYFDLYDLAPVGYCTLSATGLILEANRTAATLLGIARGELPGQPLTRFILHEDQDLYYHHRQLLLETGAPQVCELRLLRAETAPFWARLEAAAAPGADGAPACRIVLSDIAERKRTEEALQSLAKFPDENPNPIARIGGGMVLYANHAASRLLQSLGSGVGSPAPALWRDWVALALAGQAAQAAEVEYAGRTYACDVMPVTGNSYANVYATDVTQRKQAEEALRASERKYRLLVDNANEAIVVAQDGRLVFVNRMASEIMGYSEQELTARLFGAFIHPDDRGLVAERYQRRLKGDVFQPRYEFRLVARDGSVKWAEIGAVLIDWEGRPATLNFIGDITERKRAEEALRASEARLQDIIFSIGDWVWEVDQNGVYTYSSQQASEFFGASRAGIIGKTPFDFMPPDEARRVAALFRKIVAEKAPIKDLENWNVGKNGARICLLTNGVPILDDKGNLKGYRGVDKDITERKRAEEEWSKLQAQLAQAQKMEAVGRLAGGVAHDFNNQLTVIIGNAELALETLDRTQPLYADLEQIIQAGKRSAEITQQLLAFARKQTIAPRVLDLNETVEGMLKMLRRLIGEDIDLAWRPGQGLWPVKLDPSQVNQILANLCVNARDAIAGVGQVSIATGNVTCDQAYCAAHPDCVPGEYVLLAVSDDGCGMERGMLDKIFEPFFTTKQVGQGIGLGLPTIYGIVQQNEGHITVESAPGQGTTFRIYLPRYVAQAGETGATGAGQTPHGRDETILLVEDELTILRMIKRMLEALDYRVLAASTPDAALRLAAEHAGEIHLLLTDVIMPGMSGRELAQRLLARYPQLRCLYMSGYTADVISERGLLEEGLNLIQKPMSQSALAAQVREVLDQ